MAAPTLVFSEANGSGAGTKTDNVTTINFAAQDLNSATPGLITNYPIAAGTNSAEKYNLLKVTGAAPNSLSGFSIYFSATAPQDGGGSTSTVAVKFGVTNTYAVPVTTTSTVATTATGSVTSAPGTAITAPANTIGAYSGYFVQQLQVAAGATGGNAVFPSNWLQAQYTYS